MFALKTCLTVASPKLLQNCELIAKNLFLQRSVCIAAAALHAPCKQSFNSLSKSAEGSIEGLNCKRLSIPATLKSLHFGYRDYVTKKSEPIQATPPSTPPNLPQRDQIERACFRVIALIWDCGFVIFSWLQKVIKNHVVEDPTVQQYWKRFHEKMAESKKND